MAESHDTGEPDMVIRVRGDYSEFDEGIARRERDLQSRATTFATESGYAPREREPALEPSRQPQESFAQRREFGSVQMIERLSNAFERHISALERWRGIPEGPGSANAALWYRQNQPEERGGFAQQQTAWLQALSQTERSALDQWYTSAIQSRQNPDILPILSAAVQRAPIRQGPLFRGMQMTADQFRQFSQTSQEIDVPLLTSFTDRSFQAGEFAFGQFARERLKRGDFEKDRVTPVIVRIPQAQGYNITSARTGVPEYFAPGRYSIENTFEGVGGYLGGHSVVPVQYMDLRPLSYQTPRTEGNAIPDLGSEFDPEWLQRTFSRVRSGYAEDYPEKFASRTRGFIRRLPRFDDLYPSFESGGPEYSVHGGRAAMSRGRRQPSVIEQIRQLEVQERQNAFNRFESMYGRAAAVREQEEGFLQQESILPQLLEHPRFNEFANYIPQQSQYLGHGNEAVAFRIPSGNVLRLGFGDRPRVSGVLQPFASRTEEGLTIEELPFVQSGALARRQQARLSRRLAGSGYALDPFESTSQNLGTTQAGEPIVIDPGAVFQMAGFQPRRRDARGRFISREAQAAQEQQQYPLERLITMYRGENEGARPQNIPSWMEENLGRWFTRSLETAQQYGTRVNTVRVPERIARGSFAGQGTFERPQGIDEFVLPREWAQRASPLEAVDEAGGLLARAMRTHAESLRRTPPLLEAPAEAAAELTSRIERVSVRRVGGGGGRQPPQLPGPGGADFEEPEFYEGEFRNISNLPVVGGGGGGGSGTTAPPGTAGPGGTPPGGQPPFRSPFASFVRGLGSVRIPRFAFFQAIFGAWEFSRAVRAYEEGGLEAALSETPIQNLQRQNTTINQITGGLFGGLAGIGLDVLSRATGGLTISPSGVQEDLLQQTRRVTDQEQVFQLYRQNRQQRVVRELTETRGRNAAQLEEARQKTQNQDDQLRAERGNITFGLAATEEDIYGRYLRPRTGIGIGLFGVAGLLGAIYSGPGPTRLAIRDEGTRNAMRGRIRAITDTIQANEEQRQFLEQEAARDRQETFLGIQSSTVAASDVLRNVPTPEREMHQLQARQALERFQTERQDTNLLPALDVMHTLEQQALRTTQANDMRIWFAQLATQGVINRDELAGQPIQAIRDRVRAETAIALMQQGLTPDQRRALAVEGFHQELQQVGLEGRQRFIQSIGEGFQIQAAQFNLGAGALALARQPLAAIQASLAGQIAGVRAQFAPAIAAVPEDDPDRKARLRHLETLQIEAARQQNAAAQQNFLDQRRLETMSLSGQQEVTGILAGAVGPGARLERARAQSIGTVRQTQIQMQNLFQQDATDTANINRVRQIGINQLEIQRNQFFESLGVGVSSAQRVALGTGVSANADTFLKNIQDGIHELVRQQIGVPRAQ